MKKIQFVTNGLYAIGFIIWQLYHECCPTDGSECEGIKFNVECEFCRSLHLNKKEIRE